MDILRVHLYADANISVARKIHINLWGRFYFPKISAIFSTPMLFYNDNDSPFIKTWGFCPFPSSHCGLWLDYNQKNQQYSCCVNHLAVLRWEQESQWNLPLDPWDTSIL
jgi:hypothetical protein